MTDKRLSRTYIIDTPDSARELYEREANRIFKPAPYYHEVGYSDELHRAISAQVTTLNHGQGNYRGFTKTNNPDPVWYNARRVPMRNPGEFYLIGNCNDWSPSVLVRLRSIGIDRGALSLALCWYGSDAHLGSKGRNSEGHMVLIIHTTKGDLVACSKIGLHWLTAGALDYHNITAAEYGPNWTNVQRSNSLLDLIEGAAI